MDATLSAVMGQGFPSEVPWVVFEYPLFLVGSDLTPLREKTDEVIGRLTSWRPTRTTTGMVRREPVIVSGRDYAEAFQRVQSLFLRNKWGDGTTVTPPTRDMVDWILAGTDHESTDPVGGGKAMVMPRGGILTYEVLATCLAMAGGRPEYLPVLDAACRSVVGKESIMLTSSLSAYPGMLVNGPVGKQIRLSSGFGLFGPDPVRPAGTTIGRALWFVLQDVGGLVAGTGTIAQFGEMRHSCLCFSENEDAIPTGWTSYAEEYHGKPRGTNTATYFLVRGGGVRGFTHRGTGDEPSFEVEMLESFHRAASVMKTIPTSGVPRDHKGVEGMLVYPGLICKNMAAIGWSKDKIKKSLADQLYYLIEEVRHLSGILRACKKEGTDIDTLPQRVALYTEPQRIRLVVAGGDHPSRAMWIPNLDVQGIADIELPTGWNELLKQADRELGPAPTDF